MKLDHLAVTCRDLDVGCQWVEDQLGVPLLPGGEHPHFGTHNRLLRLGDGEYFEVIAPNPKAPKPDHPRWFDLDRAPEQPRLGNWIVQTSNLAEILPRAPAELGHPIALSRGDLSWQLTVPEDGSLPMGGAWPTLIEWPDGVHPAQNMPDAGVRLTRLTITHPFAAKLAEEVLPKLDDPRISFAEGPEIKLAAEFDTPNGPRNL